MASLATRAIVAGPSRPATVLGSSTHAVWLGLGSDVIVLSTRDATRLPNSLEIPRSAEAAPFLSVASAGFAGIGCGAVSVGDLVVRVARWWDPQPTLQRTGTVAVRRRIEDITTLELSVDSSDLVRATNHNDPGALLRAAGGLLGLGGGLTPEGDDLVAGFVSGLRLLGRALGRTDAVATIEAIGPPLTATAYARTTTFSAALLRHAVHGEVAAPAAAFLHALTGRGDANPEYRTLAAVGHMSGIALAAGILLAAHTLIEGDDT